MPRIRRSGKVLVLVLALITTSTGTWWIYGPAPLSIGQAEGQGTPVVEAADRAIVWGLLESVDLDREALIALNVNQPQAQELLTAVDAWREQHGAELAMRQASVTARLAAVRVLGRDVRSGTAAPAQLAEAQQALAIARQAHASYLDGLRSTITSKIAESQRLTWTAIVHGWGREMPVRMLMLTSEQKQAYAQAVRAHQLGMAAAETPEEQAAVDAAWKHAQEAIFTPDNLQVIAAYNSYAGEAAMAVEAADAEALPTADDVG